jgi:hypothetical protein
MANASKAAFPAIVLAAFPVILTIVKQGSCPESDRNGSSG